MIIHFYKVLVSLFSIIIPSFPSPSFKLLLFFEIFMQFFSDYIYPPTQDSASIPPPIHLSTSAHQVPLCWLITPGCEAALECGLYISYQTTEENRLSIFQQQPNVNSSTTRGGISYLPSPFLAEILSGFNLYIDCIGLCMLSQQQL